ncbi:NitT/TauT family transport system substrate-binding protein [Bacillus sp. SORGH_AS 510]|uniref:aliphatic sulfonate ABC transporter substrate-binding protein n=1 Tax=Bacillus sp. SORGH_AS_0510 TaxID=3041771 RepID=UPI002785A947|nr:aliphatic sulfonate ABC transporter substrate-binding protein [Bacillus sp. SORGH_AS_0510]MDQ1145978.1 NitT/TauT family transport system substrate-binding protein [Bacillus sp. SORGH_AS_0510]
MKKRTAIISLLFLLLMGALAGCGTDQASSGSGKEEKKVVIGYFPNIDHAPAMIAREKGYYEKELGNGVKVEYKTFPDGGAFMTALKTGEIDAGLVGPGPVMNNFTNGADVKIIAGASSGGTAIVASKKSGVNSVEDFKGKTFITPGVGCTHDVQMETFLQDFGISSARIGGTLKHVTGNPAQYAAMFESGKVDIAAVPEPWASQLVKEAGAKIIVDSKKISFGTTLPNTILVSSGKKIKSDKEIIQKIVDAQNEAIAFIKKNPEEAKEITIKSIKESTKQELDKDIVDGAWKNIRFTTDVNKDVIQDFANSSVELKFLKEKPDFAALIDSQFIN